MTSKRKQFGTALATNFLNEVQYQRNNYYYFLGKLEPWNGSDTPPIDTQSLSYYEDVKIRNNSAFFKKITPNDITLVAKRNDWQTGVVFAQWNDTIDMETLPFFVFTSDGKVYKCLNNNNGAASTVMPTGQSFSAFKTSDGYTWKYMYTVPGFKRTRFTSTNYIPVQKALSEGFYNQGSIESVSVLNTGSGYSDNQQTQLVVTGTTTGTGATATFTRNDTGTITSVTVTNGGSGYTKGCKIRITGEDGTGAILTPNITAGVITSVTINNGGAAYTYANQIEFVVGGCQLLPKINQSGSIVDVIILDAGIGYSATPTISITTSIPATVDGLYDGNSTALLEAVVDAGSVQRVLIRDPGVGYPALTNTSLTVVGDGVGLEVTPVVHNGEIIDVIIENSGYGYTHVELTVNSSIGSGAVFRPIYANSEIISDQTIVEQMGVDGEIYSIVVTEQGTGYTSTTQVSIQGNGTGATAHAVLNGSTIEKIVVDTWGSGYTTVNVVITDANRVELLTPLVNASAYAILPPVNGHGTDAVKELYGRTVAIASSIRVDPILADYNQDYRQFGILSQPRNLISNKTSTIDFDYSVYKATFNNITNLVVDSVLILNNYYRFRVVDIENAIVFLQPLFKGYVEPIGVLTVEGNLMSQYISTSILTRPIINKYSGNLLYVANEEPFEFSDTQGLLIKTYISF